MQVTVRFPDGDESTFVLGSREVLAWTPRSTSTSTHRSRRSAAPSTASGRREAEYVLPNGQSVTVEILGAKPYQA